MKSNVLTYRIVFEKDTGTWLVQRRYFLFFWVAEREVIDSDFYEYEVVKYFGTIAEAADYIRRQIVYDAIRRSK